MKPFETTENEAYSIDLESLRLASLWGPRPGDRGPPRDLPVASMPLGTPAGSEGLGDFPAIND
jgi:hypothetical protein